MSVDANKTRPMDEQEAQQDSFDDEPIPLIQPVPIPQFPVDAFPEAIADMVNEVAEATQTDPAMAATSAISALSACTGGHAEIEIRSGWREPLCTYTTTVAEPGERKSAVQQTVSEPLLDAERELIKAGEASRREAEISKSVANMAERKRGGRPPPPTPKTAPTNSPKRSTPPHWPTRSRFRRSHACSPTTSPPRSWRRCSPSTAAGWRSSPPRAASSTSSPAATRATSPTWTCGSRATRGIKSGWTGRAARRNTSAVPR